ncbi:aldehyde dehydrogenase [Arenibacter sp. GZD96]|uniref:aldehyde dehydrogenase n=1 Tax=Aurantibrevibacter litoralis TaxID=3106030 RepID=UPI002AFFD683|nr:aldehyde dehydrogenase [Arenibacter sp. GZD-96]MEA1785244.1 aldehyde dehydrogenase [Arenibacter sp. GZD-96]
MKTFSEIRTLHRDFFLSEITKSILYRKSVLKKLYQEIVVREDAICDALYADFKKPKFEVLLSETQIVLAELKRCIRKLDSWSRPERIRSAVVNFPSSDWIYKEPYGNVLVISPWNYPFMLAMMPLIGAVAAGNTVIVKPSEKSPNTSALLTQIVGAVFNPNHVQVVLGNVAVAQQLLALQWDYIFFTGSSNVGKIVYEKAAKHLTPVTLELGGKNPCIVDTSASIDLAAKRIVWGKFFNAGQTCVAPDYILVHQQVKPMFTQALVKWITYFYGNDIAASPHFARIVNSDHLRNLIEKLKDETIIFGGTWDSTTNYLSPTLVDSPSWDSALMQDEIFGPILPILSYESEADIEHCLTKFGKPLATYIFSNNRRFQNTIIANYSFGGGVINDVLIHLGNHRLPFGGVGQSGMGAYRGKRTFTTFTHHKPISKKANWVDIPLRYAPYTLSTKIAKALKKFF